MQNGKFLLQIDCKDIPDELKQKLHQKILSHHELNQKHDLLKHLSAINEHDGTIKLTIN